MLLGAEAVTYDMQFIENFNISNNYTIYNKDIIIIIGYTKIEDSDIKECLDYINKKLFKNIRIYI